MRELPILFSTPMVRAILDGRKTVTRRVVKPQPPHIKYWALTYFDCDKNGNPKIVCPDDTDNSGIKAWADKVKVPCKPGDRLWVRETWRPVNADKFHEGAAIDYAADWNADYFENSREKTCCNGGKWKPSIHMPKWAARIWLEVTAVRVERLQEISEEDAKAEGIKSYWAEPHRDVAPFIGAGKELGVDLCHTRRKAFQQLWEHLNAKRGYGWNTNPWVWVIEFKRL